MPPENKIPNNSEIDQALREFEMKSAPVAVPTSQARGDSDIPKMVKWVMKLGIKDQKQAEYVLLGFAIIAIALSLYLFFGLRKTTLKMEPPAGYRIIYPPGEPPRLEPVS